MSKDTPSNLIKEIERELDEFMTKIPEKRCMYKVHEQLRDVSEKAYKPVLLAIGPYNHRIEVGEGFMEEHKLRYLQQMIKRTEGSVETYIKALLEKENEIRKHYSERIYQDSRGFVKMMLLDGCFIIELFRKYKVYRKTRNKAHIHDPIFRMKWVLPRIARDLLLFENQLPFFILAQLFGMSKRGSSQTSLTVLALRFFSNYLPFRWNVNATNYNSKDKIESLLCLTHKAQTFSLRRMVMGRLELGFRFKNEDFKHLLGLIHASISISILDTEINNAIEPHEEELAEICKHVFCLISEAVTRLLAKIKNKRNPERGEGYSEDNMPKTDQDRERELIPLRSELKEVRVVMAAAPTHEIEGCGSDDGYSEDNMAKTDRDREMKLIPARSELKNVPVIMAAAPTHEIEGCGSDDGYSEDKMPKTDQHWEMNICSAPTSMAAPMDGHSEDNMPKTDQDRESDQLLWFRSELKEAKVESQMAEEFEKDFYKIKRWEDELNAPCASELFEAGIEFEKAKKFMVLVRHHEHQMTIPYRKLLREAGVETKRAIKFMDLLALKEIEDLNIHSATELEEAGIEFKKSAKDMKSKEEMFCIKLNKGKMEVSPLSIEDQTEACFRNLIAYEQYSCYGDKDFNYVTDYVSFMDSLIDSPKDVQLLRDRGIIRNYLGDDEVISKMVNKLVHNINLSTSIYARTSKYMNMHCRKLWPKSKANLRHDYFNSPWACISFLAAVLLLGLTIVQTIFSIIP